MARYKVPVPAVHYLHLRLHQYGVRSAVVLYFSELRWSQACRYRWILGNLRYLVLATGTGTKPTAARIGRVDFGWLACWLAG